MKFKNKQNRNKICRDVGICSNSSRKARDYQKNQNNRYIMGGRRQWWGKNTWEVWGTEKNFFGLGLECLLFNVLLNCTFASCTFWTFFIFHNNKYFKKSNGTCSVQIGKTILTGDFFIWNPQTQTKNGFSEVCESLKL